MNKQNIKVAGVGNVDIVTWGVCTDVDRWTANRIISRSHYLPAPSNGYIIGCRFANIADQKRILRSASKKNKVDKWSEAWTEKPGMMIGCAVLNNLVYANPAGRRDIAELEGAQGLLKGQWHKADRKAVLADLAVAWCSRFAIDAPYRGIGIGSLLAKEILTVGKSFRVPQAKYIEVITTHKASEAKELLDGRATKNDFLIRAGYNLVKELRPSTPMIKVNPQTGEKIEILSTKKLYYYSPCD